MGFALSLLLSYSISMACTAVTCSLLPSPSNVADVPSLLDAESRRGAVRAGLRRSALRREHAAEPAGEGAQWEIPHSIFHVHR